MCGTGERSPGLTLEKYPAAAQPLERRIRMYLTQLLRDLLLPWPTEILHVGASSR